MLLQTILIGLVGVYTEVDSALGSLYTFRPIFTSFLVGIILGDVKLGLTIGATLELFFMGSISMGSYIPPDSEVGGILATAFAISSGLGVEAALALAMPIALISLGIKSAIYMIVTAMAAVADKFAKRGNAKGVTAIFWSSFALKCLNKFIWCFIGFYFGADVVTSVITGLPTAVVDGMAVASGILPGLGFAMLLNMVFSKKTLPFFFLGFALSAYLKVPIIGVLIFAAIIIFTAIDWNNDKTDGEATANGF